MIIHIYLCDYITIHTHTHKNGHGVPFCPPVVYKGSKVFKTGSTDRLTDRFCRFNIQHLATAYNVPVVVLKKCGTATGACGTVRGRGPGNGGGILRYIAACVGGGHG